MRISAIVAIAVLGCSKPRAPADRDAAIGARSDGSVARAFDAAAPPIDARADDPRTHATAIDSGDTFRRFAEDPGGVVRSGRVVKFLIDNREYPKPDPPIYYINGNYTAGGSEPVEWAALHRTWALKVVPDFDYSLKAFSKTAYFTRTLSEREFISGRVQTFERNGEVFYGVWFIEMDLISGEMLRFALEQIKRTFQASDHPLHYVAYSTHQKTESIAPWLAANGFVVHQLSDLLADVTFRSLNPGEAWGFVRVAPADPDRLEPTDIPVFDVLPLDLGVVAGTVTTAFQDVASHVNIKAKQRHTPNLMLREPDEVKRLKALDGTPIHLVVTADDYRFEPSTAAEVERAFERLMSKRAWTMPAADLEGEMVTFDAMCGDAEPSLCLERARRFGGKAAGLGFLAHPEVLGVGSHMQKRLGYRLTPLGFAVPIAAYKRFVDHNAAKNPALRAALDRLMNSERGVDGAKPLGAAARAALIKEIQAMFLAAEIPPALSATVAAQIDELRRAYAARFPGETLSKIKVRSSANVEDIPDFSGAGLHDSHTARLDEDDKKPCRLVSQPGKRGVKQKLEPRTVDCAIKAVYASLWNLRAVRERTFRRFDHRGALMGLAISPSYKHRKKTPRKKIAANSVLITRVLNSPTVYGYQLATQKGDNLVTNPDPGTLAEVTTMTFQLASVPAPTILQHAKPKADKPARDKPLLSTETMRRIVAIGRAVEEAYCRAKPTYFVVNGKARKCHQVSNSQSKPTALDMELKIYGNGEILLKQVREFQGR